MAETVLENVRERGDAAVLKYAAEFDGVRLRAPQMRLKKSELTAAREKLDASQLEAIREAHARISRFATGRPHNDLRPAEIGIRFCAILWLPAVGWLWPSVAECGQVIGPINYNRGNPQKC